MEILRKIRKLPKGQRKIIFWLIVGMISIGLLVCWVHLVKLRIRRFEENKIERDLNIFYFEEEFKKFINSGQLMK